MRGNSIWTLCDEACGKYQSEVDPDYVGLAQDILKILTTSSISVGSYVIIPLWIEAYYGTKNDIGDSHCCLMQMNRRNKLYFHRRGRGGVDLVLSSKLGFAWSVLIKACQIDGVNYGQVALRRFFREKGISEECQWAIEGDLSMDLKEPKIGFAPRIGVKKYPELSLSCYRLGMNNGSSSSNLYTVYRYIVTHPENY